LLSATLKCDRTVINGHTVAMEASSHGAFAQGYALACGGEIFCLSLGSILIITVTT
jgi:hypothetical protein